MLCEAYAGESMVANSLIDIDALRKARSKPAMTNLLARQRLELFQSVYASPNFYPADNLLDANGATKVPDRSHFLSQQAGVIERLHSAGIFTHA